MAGHSEAAAQAPWLTTAQKKKDLQTAAIAPYRSTGLHSKHAPQSNAELILGINEVSDLASFIRTRQLKAYDVVLAYIQKTEILFDDALERAEQLDKILSSTGKPVGPLHGVPMTVKDQFNIKGYDSTLGYVGRSFNPATEDADIVKILKDAGAVFIAKTNLPQSIMWCETENFIFGRTDHPLDSAYTPGGSTGGESALLALRGSMCGFGTDLGGSVRIPSHMTGVYGFKPSVRHIRFNYYKDALTGPKSERLPYEGTPVSTEGQEHVPSSVGPLARSLASIHLVTKLIIEAAPWRNDPRVQRLPWNEDVYQSIQSRPLTVGLLIDDGVVKVHPSVERVVLDIAAKLERAGHTIVPWTTDGHAECIEVMDKYFTADGGEDLRRDIAKSGEPLLPRVQGLVSTQAISVYGYWALHRRKRAAQRAYLKKWQAIRNPTTGDEVDIILSPVMSHPAVKHRTCNWVGYTKVWNLLDYTALSLPAGRVDAAIDPSLSDPTVASYVPRNDMDKWNWGLYDPESSNHMPINIQLIGRRLEEEKVLGAARVVESVLDR
ncbi:hypothetical protein LTR37_008676 [Vermiconidia calcicola]|uniref:Uncharacterized protein n=1 Tax=Vermiconidia calcicola TaxID=1690605 RepID=A0ACC3NAC8_9PEZI|nr:hypothetical protein LTR37_008676 [Vermiconidia calcicola]